MMASSRPFPSPQEVQAAVDNCQALNTTQSEMMNVLQEGYGNFPPSEMREALVQLMAPYVTQSKNVDSIVKKLDASMKRYVKGLRDEIDGYKTLGERLTAERSRVADEEQQQKSRDERQNARDQGQNDRDQRQDDADNRLAARNITLVELEAMLKERESDIVDREARVAALAAQIEADEERLRTKKKQAAEKDEELRRREAAVTEKEAALVRREEVAAEKETKVKDREQMATDREKKQDKRADELRLGESALAAKETLFNELRVEKTQADERQRKDLGEKLGAEIAAGFTRANAVAERLGETNDALTKVWKNLDACATRGENAVHKMTDEHYGIRKELGDAKADRVKMAHFINKTADNMDKTANTMKQSVDRLKDVHPNHVSFGETHRQILEAVNELTTP